MSVANGHLQNGSITRHFHPGFTLLELMLVMGLATLVYALISYVTIQMNNSVRRAEIAYKRKKAVIEIAERMRWQLRCLYANVPQGSSSQPPSSNTNPATLLKSYIYSKGGDQENQDSLIFKTTYFPSDTIRAGTAEVGYKIISDSGSGSLSLTSPVTDENKLLTKADRERAELKALEAQDLLEGDSFSQGRDTFLAYRQYPWADPLGLHETGDDSNVPWQEVSREVTGMSVRFSDDLEIWQQDWTEPGKVPKWIEITLTLRHGEPLIFMAAPGTAAARW